MFYYVAKRFWACPDFGNIVFWGKDDKKSDKRYVTGVTVKGSLIEELKFRCYRPCRKRENFYFSFFSAGAKENIFIFSI